MADRGSSPKPELPTSLPLWFPAAPSHCSRTAEQTGTAERNSDNSTQAKPHVIGGSWTSKILFSLLTQRAVD